MKRVIALWAVLLPVLLFAGCGTEKADIPVDKLSWTLEEGTAEGHSYVYFQMTNHSDITIQSTAMTFRIKEAASQEQKDQFLRALQESQGFSDAFMQDYLQRLEQNGNFISLIATVLVRLEPDTGCQPQQCYYMGGWTSRDLIYIELFEPASLSLIYERDGKNWEQTYDFATGTYTVAPAPQQQ